MTPGAETLSAPGDSITISSNGELPVSDTDRYGNTQTAATSHATLASLYGDPARGATPVGAVVAAPATFSTAPYGGRPETR